MRALGIDPGLSGGIALVEGDHVRGSRLIFATDVPTTGVGSKRRVDVARVLALVQKDPPDFALIERAQAMPDQGSSSGFNYGRAVGYLEACILGMQIPLDIIESRAWKTAHGLFGIKDREGKTPPQNVIKEASRQRAMQLWPSEAMRFFPNIGHHNRAESALIAAYGVALNAGQLFKRA